MWSGGTTYPRVFGPPDHAQVGPRTADFTCVEQFVYSVAWPYTCNSITESRHGINQLFNASEIRCTADFTCVEQLVYSVAWPYRVTHQYSDTMYHQTHFYYYQQMLQIIYAYQLYCYCYKIKHMRYDRNLFFLFLRICF